MLCKVCRQELFDIERKSVFLVYENPEIDPVELFIEQDNRLADCVQKNPNNPYSLEDYLFLRQTMYEAALRVAFCAAHDHGYIKTFDGQWRLVHTSTKEPTPVEEPKESGISYIWQRIKNFLFNLFRKRIKYIEKVVLIDNNSPFSITGIDDINVYLATGWHVKSVTESTSEDGKVKAIFVLTSKEV